MQSEYVLFVIGTIDRQSLVKQYYVINYMSKLRALSVYNINHRQITHNCYGPADYSRSEKNLKTIVIYYDVGRVHRKYGPAEIYFDGTMIFRVEYSHRGGRVFKSLKNVHADYGLYWQKMKDKR